MRDVMLTAVVAVLGASALVAADRAEKSSRCVSLVCRGLASVAGAIAQAEPSLAGDWTCHGTGPDGKTYGLALKVEARENSLYRLEWINGPHVTQIGLGMLTGDVLSVGIADLIQGALMTAVYQVESGAMVGRWTGGGEVFRETCERAGARAAD